MDSPSFDQDEEQYSSPKAGSSRIPSSSSQAPLTGSGSSVIPKQSSRAPAASRAPPSSSRFPGGSKAPSLSAINEHASVGRSIAPPSSKVHRDDSASQAQATSLGGRDSYKQSSRVPNMGTTLGGRDSKASQVPNMGTTLGGRDSSGEITANIGSSFAPPSQKSILTKPEDIKRASMMPKIEEMSPEEKKKQLAWVYEYIAKVAQCPEGWKWDRREDPPGFQCGGKAHSMTDELIREGKGGMYAAKDHKGKWGEWDAVYYPHPNGQKGNWLESKRWHPKAPKNKQECLCSQDKNNDCGWIDGQDPWTGKKQ